MITFYFLICYAVFQGISTSTFRELTIGNLKDEDIMHHITKLIDSFTNVDNQRSEPFNALLSSKTENGANYIENLNNINDHSVYVLDNDTPQKVEDKTVLSDQYLSNSRPDCKKSLAIPVFIEIDNDGDNKENNEYEINHKYNEERDVKYSGVEKHETADNIAATVSNTYMGDLELNPEADDENTKTGLRIVQYNEDTKECIKYLQICARACQYAAEEVCELEYKLINCTKAMKRIFRNECYNNCAFEYNCHID
ncbi:hypothetical protein K1T71_013892 [Dendrolimus kikuchii]|uniref:Uncharacterized protein n=1 Tax=Dendrolimus kikuchii TaxID=765133 RepID=A0ACC1CG17_9NEOP|nr:hypothetical protein K1T71_013892 [Dendrolimus kikuchii]